MLEAALGTETDPFLVSRYRFYLAQSYRDCGGEGRRRWRTTLPGRGDLAFGRRKCSSPYQAARMKEQLEHPEDEVIEAYFGRRLCDAGRSAHGASRYCRHKRRFEEGYEFARRGLKIPFPDGGLFIEPWIYEYGLLDEMGVHGYWSGYYEERLRLASAARRGQSARRHARPDQKKRRIRGRDI